MKQRIRLTEGDLHNVINESVKTVLNEVGEKLAKQYGLPPEYGPYLLARIAQKKSNSQGRRRQSDSFDEYAQNYFNRDYGVNNKDVEMYMDDEGVPVINGVKYRPESDLGPEGSDRYETRKNNREKIQRKIPDMKAWPRNRVNKGVDIFDKTDEILNNLNF